MRWESVGPFPIVTLVPRLTRTRTHGLPIDRVDLDQEDCSQNRSRTHGKRMNYEFIEHMRDVGAPELSG